MHAVVGLLLVVAVLFAVYYLNAAGFFLPLSDAVTAISGGFNGSYSRAESTSTSYGAVRIGSVVLGAGVRPDEIDIAAHPRTGGVNVSGWTLKTDKGTYKIPQVVNAYSASTPDAALEDVFMRDGDRLAIYSGSSPTKRNERTTQSEYHVWFGDFLKAPHGTITLRDAKKLLVATYSY